VLTNRPTFDCFGRKKSSFKNDLQLDLCSLQFHFSLYWFLLVCLMLYTIVKKVNFVVILNVFLTVLFSAFEFSFLLVSLYFRFRSANSNFKISVSLSFSATCFLVCRFRESHTISFFSSVQLTHNVTPP
jgi:hypothetical protein